MNSSKFFFGFLPLLLTTVSCDPRKDSVATDDLLSNCPIVGTYTQVGDDKVLSSSQELFKDTIRIPLSFFTEEPQFIKLDNRDEALVAEAGITVSDNYILVHSSYPPTAFKLFDREGKFISNVGGVGQGPGEYGSIYHTQIDEANNRIYMMPWQTRNLLVYDLEGNFQNAIPLCHDCPKSTFRVDAEKGTVSVCKLPFPGSSAVAWTQDFEGKEINRIEPSKHLMARNFNNEVIFGENIPGVFDISVPSMDPARVDSLYHYDTSNGRLRPAFTFNCAQTDEVPWHFYNEWPDHFVGSVSGPPVVIHSPEGTGQIPGKTDYYIVDKETGKGAYFKLYNDYFGDQEIGYSYSAFSKGYYIRNIEPGNLQTEVEQLLQNSGLSEEMRKNLTDIQASVNDNDNNYLFVARLKK